jgi:ribonuclease HI
VCLLYFPRIKEVIWHPPVFNWIKCNIDGACKGNPGLSSCGGIFRNSEAAFIGAFACNLGISNSLSAELHGAMFAIEIASQKGWTHLWLETDSVLVTLAFKSIKIVPWQLRNRWLNCLHLCNSMSFFVTHVFREGNHCADKLAATGFSLQTQMWWDSLPGDICIDFIEGSLS